jgi:hypothetical protein
MKKYLFRFIFTLILLVSSICIKASCPVNIDEALRVVAKRAGLTDDEISVFIQSFDADALKKLRGTLVDQGYLKVRKTAIKSLPTPNDGLSTTHRAFLAKESKRAARASDISEYLTKNTDLLNPLNPSYPLDRLLASRSDVLALEGIHFNYSQLVEEFDRILYIRASDDMMKISKISDTEKRLEKLKEFLDDFNQAGLDRRRLFQARIERPLLRTSLPLRSSELAETALKSTASRTINVRNREEAEMILESILRRDPDSFMTTNVPKGFGKKVLADDYFIKTFHWDDAFEEISQKLISKSGVKIPKGKKAYQLVGHPPNNTHAMHPHLQIELSKDRVIHIQWPRPKEYRNNFFTVNKESGTVTKGYHEIKDFDW